MDAINNKIIFATNNDGKLSEIKRILKNYEIIGLKEAGINIDINEDGNTFMANSLIKVKSIMDYIDNKGFQSINTIVMADDSGLCVDSLNGFPGVETHRFLGESASDVQRNNYILKMLDENKKSERTAQFICAITVAQGKKIFHSTGVLNGMISLEPRGTNGFGFDPIFEVIYEENKRTYSGRYSGKTLAEIPTKEKNRISPRAKALRKLVKEGIL